MRGERPLGLPPGLMLVIRSSRELFVLEKAVETACTAGRGGVHATGGVLWVAGGGAARGGRRPGAAGGEAGGPGWCGRQGGRASLSMNLSARPSMSFHCSFHFQKRSTTMKTLVTGCISRIAWKTTESMNDCSLW